MRAVLTCFSAISLASGFRITRKTRERVELKSDCPKDCARGARRLRCLSAKCYSPPASPQLWSELGEIEAQVRSSPGRPGPELVSTSEAEFFIKFFIKSPNTMGCPGAPLTMTECEEAASQLGKGWMGRFANPYCPVGCYNAVSH